MIRTPLPAPPPDLPALFSPFLRDAILYDSSCSPQARVYFLDKDDGYYLKRSPKGTLEREARLTRYFHDLGLGAEVLAYHSLDEDWLLTRRLAGEDLTHPSYLADPKRLCDTLSERLAYLHALPCDGCPLIHKTAYFAIAETNYRAGRFDPSYADNPDLTPETAWQAVETGKHRLASDTLLHGDYCLPNLLFSDWAFSGLIDLGNGGIGDRHVDLFWGAWTLRYNLKTDAFRQRFFDGYGRDRIDPERLRLIGMIETFG